MNILQRINTLEALGKFLMANDEKLIAAKQKANIDNNFFTEDFINISLNKIVTQFLQKPLLEAWLSNYSIIENSTPKKVGIVAAGNIPLVGFHDLLCVYLSGHLPVIKLSSKDTALMQVVIDFINQAAPIITVAPMLKNCDAYIATGSNNTSNYFEYYFGKYPNIIRKNRTSVAILTGNETATELQALADDMLLYFGLGCRNVTKLYVPNNYNFEPLINACKTYLWMEHHNSWRNNYDYQLSIHVLNGAYYMSSGALLFTESMSLFSPIAQVHYEFYNDINIVDNELNSLQEQIQCIVGATSISFGSTQTPSLNDYADSIDTMQFLIDLK
jgi:hypothetical protein